MIDQHAIVAGAAMVKVVWSSLAASLVITTAFSLAILGLIRVGDMRAAGRAMCARAYATLALVSLLVFGGSVAYGVVLVTQKG